VKLTFLWIEHCCSKNTLLHGKFLFETFQDRQRANLLVEILVKCHIEERYTIKGTTMPFRFDFQQTSTITRIIWFIIVLLNSQRSCPESGTIAVCWTKTRAWGLFRLTRTFHAIDHGRGVLGRIVQAGFRLDHQALAHCYLAHSDRYPSFQFFLWFIISGLGTVF